MLVGPVKVLAAAKAMAPEPDLVRAPFPPIAPLNPTEGVVTSIVPPLAPRLTGRGVVYPLDAMRRRVPPSREMAPAALPRCESLLIVRVPPLAMVVPPVYEFMAPRETLILPVTFKPPVWLSGAKMVAVVGVAWELARVSAPGPLTEMPVPGRPMLKALPSRVPPPAL